MAEKEAPNDIEEYIVDSEFDRVKDQYAELQEVFKNFAAKEASSIAHVIERSAPSPNRVVSIRPLAQKMEKSPKCRRKPPYKLIERNNITGEFNECRSAQGEEAKQESAQAGQ